MVVSFRHLKYKLFPPEDGDGVKVSLTNVGAVVRFVGLGWFGGTRRRRKYSGLCSCCGRWRSENAYLAPSCVLILHNL